MVNARRATLVLAAAALLAGCGPDKQAPAQPTQEPAATARPGTYCGQSGQQAVTDAGRPAVCTTTASDGRLRWRSR